MERERSFATEPIKKETSRTNLVFNVLDELPFNKGGHIGDLSN